MEKVGKYILKEFIASGGMAEIYKGSLEGPHGFVKDVVIKAIHPHLLRDERYIKLFLREARLWAKLNHSSIVQVYEFFEERNRYYLVMEYIRGTDLMNVIKRSLSKGKSIGVPRTIKIFEYVLSALDYAHNFRDDSENIFGIVHRDISPQNILISVNGDVKITDFGIAKASLPTGITTQGAIIGKIDYMSPEQALGKEVDLRTDIFSTGIVLWETLTGNKLFDGKNDIELLENVRRCEIISPSAINPEVDEKLDKIVLKALTYDPQFRYNSAGEFLNELKAYLREYPHRLEEEDIPTFMRELFPEYVKDYTHKTEILEEDAPPKERSKNLILIPVSFLFLVIIVLAILLFPKKVVFMNENITSSTDTFIVGNIYDGLYFDLGVEDIQIETDTLVLNETKSRPLEKATPEKTQVEESKQSSEEKRNEVSSAPDKGHIFSDTKKRQESIKKGRLSLNAIPWADVYIGKKKIGTTPIFDYETKAGIIEVTFKNDDLGVVKKKKILIEPNKETRYTEDLTK